MQIPRTSQQYDLGPKTFLLDLLIILRTFTITGYIGDISGGDTAQQQDTKLVNMIQGGGGVTLAYRSINYNVNFKSCEITEAASDQDTPPQYDVLFTVIIGDDR